MDKQILACDLDGCIFAFNDYYMDHYKQKFGLEFPSRETSDYPDVWNYEVGVASKEQVNAIWKWIDGPGNYQFWRFMPAYAGAKEFLDAAHKKFDDVYFVTSRSGPKAQAATEDALWMLGVHDPKVIISHHKVPDLLKIGATDFLDDRDKNFEDVLLHNLGNEPKFNGKLWMLDRPWNRQFNHPHVKRIQDIGEVLK